MYLMESETEGSRLEKKTDIREMEEQLRMTGLKAGMRALDAGAGTGAVARVMARLVGPAGEVVALDASPARLEQGEALARAEGIENLRFVQGDLLAPPLEKEGFDFIWSRFVFEYLSDEAGKAAIHQLVELLVPGGVLVVSDIDGYFLFNDGLESTVESDLNELMEGLSGAFDPYVGRKLYGRFYRQGLKEIQVHCMPYHFYAGCISNDHLENWRQKFDTIRDKGESILGGEKRYNQLVVKFLDHLQREDTLTYSTLFLVSGKK